MAKGGNASTTFTGSPETFQRDSIGTFTDSSFPQAGLIRRRLPRTQRHPSPPQW